MLVLMRFGIRLTKAREFKCTLYMKTPMSMTLDEKTPCRRWNKQTSHAVAQSHLPAGSSTIPNSKYLADRTHVMNNQEGETEESLLSQKIKAVLNGCMVPVIERNLSAREVELFRNIDSIKQTLSQLEELMEEAKKFSTLGILVAEKMCFLLRACSALNNGSFYTSIDALWGKESMSFEEADVTVFNRSHNVTRGIRSKADGSIVFDDRYERIATGAKSSTYSVATTSPRSNASFNVDIFGVDSCYSESAHLMPHSPECSATWFAFVPWVLNTPFIFDNDVAKWKYISKCINGFKNKTQDEAKKSAKESNVGLKHFQSNQIRLKRKKNIFDDDPCLLIIPIMTVQQVKGWNGEGYEAIVLAGNWESRTKAPEVYEMINAGSGTLLFATIDECDMACTLLRQMVLCVCKSLKSAFSHEFLSERLKDFRDNSLMQQLLLLQSCSGIDVPVSLTSNRANTHINVRKISFSNYDESIQSISRGGADDEEEAITGQDEAAVKHPAPDPALLCGKATCNWLKRMKTPFLAGADDTSTSDSSDYMATFEEEAAQRGWSTTFGAGKEVVLHPNNNCDDSLSDDE